MNAQLMAIAQECLNAAYDKSMSFPEIVKTLMGAGFDGYAVDYRRNTTAYYLAGGDSFVFDNPSSPESVAQHFDQQGVIQEIKAAQANLPSYSYTAFCKSVKAFGCAGYLVSFTGRRVLYYGITGDIHVEHFPK